MDYRIVDPNSGEPDEFTTDLGDGSSDSSSSSGRDQNTQEPDLDQDDDEECSSGSSSCSSNNGSGSSSGSYTPRAPKVGELVIHELMIDPQAVSDAKGEWVEFYNASQYTLDLSEHRLADNNKDDVEIQPSWSDSLEVGPGEYIVICADDDYFDNGGADCHGTFQYETFGGGFALANSGDEVILLSPGDIELDVVVYGKNFSVPGVAMGLDEEWSTTDGNDRESHWCEQVSMMKSGDEGTPDRHNNLCL